MASGVRVEIDAHGAAELLRSEGVADDLRRRAERIMGAANAQAPEHGYVEREPFAVDAGVSDRAWANVYTRTDLGKAMQALHDALTRAMDAGRG